MGVDRPSKGPAVDQVEIVLFGPGFGECVLVHIGQDNWIIIDSCIDISTGEGLALRYLEEIGRPLTCVKLIIATHWHDDHIRGLSDTVRRCECARFCCSSAWGREEFLTYMKLFIGLPGSARTSGVEETARVTAILDERQGIAATRIAAMADRRILAIPADELAHDRPCEIWTLSPSDLQYHRFLQELRDFIEGLGGEWSPAMKTKRRATPNRPNNTSVAAWIEMGEMAMLLGADLENVSSKEAGWMAVVSSSARPQGKAAIFKVPHHGSKNAHHDGVWTEMLIDTPYAILTPYGRGRSLPTKSDVGRILERTDQAYVTARQRRKAVRARPAAVEKTIRETVREMRSLAWVPGHVRLRNGGKEAFLDWEVTLFGGACRLKEYDIRS